MGRRSPGKRRKAVSVIGNKTIIDIRHTRKKPRYVWLSDFPDCSLAQSLEDHQTVRVTGDTPETLDLRFLVGTVAIVEGPDGARVERIAAMCKPFASRVIANTIERVDQWHFTVTKTTDTESVLTWPI